jgi:hypothetical protein
MYMYIHPCLHALSFTHSLAADVVWHGKAAWLVHFMFKLLAGPCPEVLALIDSEHFRHAFSPAPAPSAIRATLVHYDFTRYDSSWARGLYPASSSASTSTSSNPDSSTNSSWSSASGAWWHRLPGPEHEQAYLPLVLDKHNPSVQQFLQAHGWPAHADGAAHHLSAAALQSQCHAAAPAFRHLTAALLWGDSSSGGDGSSSGGVAAAVAGSLRAVVCDAIAVRGWLPSSPSSSPSAAEDPFSSAGLLQAGAAVGLVVMTVIASAMITS